MTDRFRSKATELIDGLRNARSAPAGRGSSPGGCRGGANAGERCNRARQAGGGGDDREGQGGDPEGCQASGRCGDALEGAREGPRGGARVREKLERSAAELQKQAAETEQRVQGQLNKLQETVETAEARAAQAEGERDAIRRRAQEAIEHLKEEGP